MFSELMSKWEELILEAKATYPSQPLIPREYPVPRMLR